MDEVQGGVASRETPDSPGEETLDPADWAVMRELGHRMLDDALDYPESLPERPA